MLLRISVISRACMTKPVGLPWASRRNRTAFPTHTVEPSLRYSSSSRYLARLGSAPPLISSSISFCSTERTSSADSGTIISSRDCLMHSSTVNPLSFSMDGLMYLNLSSRSVMLIMSTMLSTMVW
ncbi:MAG: hypothetical protein A4E29_01564 [Methanomassiliicoccales archaeon PtaB.Bin134]|nr:MAG: hypothetical protein A4E29_01564 [Methanomassiliicoccales archaeon PtaB.Bin134]